MNSSSSSWNAETVVCLIVNGAVKMASSPAPFYTWIQRIRERGGYEIPEPVSNPVTLGKHDVVKIDALSCCYSHFFLGILGILLLHQITKGAFRWNQRKEF